MKFFHTADWHLGKLVQGLYMTEDQRYILDRFVEDAANERPDAIIIAGDLYDRAVPPTEAVQLLNEVLDKIVLDLKIPVIAVAGNHDSPSRLHFGSTIMEQNGFHIVGQFQKEREPVVMKDEFGEVHFHLVPYCDPSVVRAAFEDEEIRTHDDAMKKICETIYSSMSDKARNVFVGHAFVTPHGEPEENTSDSERPLSVGGAEHVSAHHFVDFNYTALGHLHQAHHVLNETIRYAGSILKYSASEATHKKGYYVVEIDGDGNTEVEKRLLEARRDLRIVEAKMDDLLKQPICDDYVFVRLLDEMPILSPMERIRSVYPNCLHVERVNLSTSANGDKTVSAKKRSEMSDMERFEAFYKEVQGNEPSDRTVDLFKEILDEWLHEERETVMVRKAGAESK
ncbi:exonuclease SbcCD subunit D [Aciduricibacillus chroicocephali]|uniref:Nuclease SbcCD subunit D n=1 Tax=Aciduricibacillus chroicocephali TaxID=3054939 RepID=A0ABY9KY63_9BACI|nr:exonuclease SbcCD subunit D [Bacillaceae bacterium 44XB]